MNRIKVIALLSAAVLVLSVCENHIGSAPTEALDNGVREIKAAGTLGVERAGHTATRLTDGSVLISGGMRRNGEFHDTAEVFDPKSGLFKTLGARMVKKRVSHTATLLKDGSVLIVGGWSNAGGPESSSEIFDPKTGLFTPSADLALARSGHSSSLLPNGDVLIAGGSHGGASTGSIEIFNAKKMEFREAGNLRHPRNMHTATVLDSGNIFFAGGQDNKGAVLATTEIFDVRSLAGKASTPALQTARYKHDAVLLNDGRVLVFGGSNARDHSGRFRSAEIYDPVKETIEKTGDLNTARFKISSTSVVLDDGKVLIAGGAERAEMYDPVSGEFTLVKGSYGAAYHYASVTLLDDGRALIVGGYRFGPPTGPESTAGVWLFAA